MYRLDAQGNVVADKAISGSGRQGKPVKVFDEGDLTEVIMIRLTRPDKQKIVAMLNRYGATAIAPGVAELLLKLAHPDSAATLRNLKDVGVPKSRYERR